MLKVYNITLLTNEGVVELEVKEGFFVHEESNVFPYQVKVQDGSIVKHGQEQ